MLKDVQGISMTGINYVTNEIKSIKINCSPNMSYLKPLDHYQFFEERNT